MKPPPNSSPSSQNVLLQERRHFGSAAYPVVNRVGGHFFPDRFDRGARPVDSLMGQGFAGYSPVRWCRPFRVFGKPFL